MKIIHSSSIAYNQPVAAKAQTGGGNSAVISSLKPDDAQSKKPATSVKEQPSTTEAFKTALYTNGLGNNKQNQQTQYLNTSTQKALQAYTENHLQVARSQIAETLAGIDLYA